MEEIRQPALTMLKLYFFNVGDGDSILIEDIDGDKVFRMLVDAGQETVAEPLPSARCADHLRRMGIDHLDKVFITHLHTDHAGGLGAVMDLADIGEVISGYLPLRPGAQIPPDPSAEKTVRGLIACVNQWSRDIQRLQQKHVRTTELFATLRNVHLTPRLSADFIVPDVAASRLQRQVWNNMLEGRSVPNDQKVRTSKLRNPNSLRMRLHYAGREIELAADCYGMQWENEATPCHILKVPHHGDMKSLTDALVARLHPSYAVISCARGYLPAKDRPSAGTTGRLDRIGCPFWFTDAYDDGIHPVHRWPSVDLTILENGTIIPPN